MYRIYLTVYLILMFAFGYWAADSFRQERAKLKYSNPKYIKDVSVFTGRTGRNDPYLTNMTGTTLMPYGNNVSIMKFETHRGFSFRVAYRITLQEDIVLANNKDPGQFATTLTLKSGGDFRVTAKVCDAAIKYRWINDFLVSFANVTLKKCPFPVGKYSYINMELPPKNIPIPIADGDYFIKFELFITATKESILVIDALLHLNNDVKRNKGKGKGKKG